MLRDVLDGLIDPLTQTLADSNLKTVHWSSAESKESCVTPRITLIRFGAMQKICHSPRGGGGRQKPDKV